jgi:cytochrome c peroxidase
MPPLSIGDDPPALQDAAAVAVAADALVLPEPPPVPEVPLGLPEPPAHPGITPGAVALGELLFWDPRLSATNATACATCHDPAKGFTASGLTSTATNKANLRHASPLVNLAWQREFGWDGRYRSLAEHLAAHARGQLGDDLATAVARIADVPGYRAHFARLGGEPSADAAVTALSAFLLTRYAGNTPWDRHERARDIPADIKAGYALFTGKAQCAVCHPPPLYTDHQYHRLGLVKQPDEGRGRVDPAQRGAFKTPTLRGAAARNAFFHDASAHSLDEAIDYHLAGGTGQGADPSIVDPALKKIALAPAERTQLGTFVRALTDTMAPSPRPEVP